MFPVNFFSKNDLGQGLGFVGFGMIQDRKSKIQNHFC